MPHDDAQLWQLLRSLDDPDHLEAPPNYHHRRVRDQFDQLARRIDADFDGHGSVDRHVQDASFHGRIEIPATATATGHKLVITISNFGGLAVLSIDNPGVWTDAETAELLHPDDARRISDTLTDLGYTLIPEEPLWETYDGVSDLARYCPDDGPPSWWIRYFDYL